MTPLEEEIHRHLYEHPVGCERCDNTKGNYSVEIASHLRELYASREREITDTKTLQQAIDNFDLSFGLQVLLKGES